MKKKMTEEEIQENLGFVAAMFMSGKVTAIETTTKATGEPVLVLCFAKKGGEGTTDLIPFGTILVGENASELYNVPEGAEEKPSTAKDFEELVGKES